MMTYDDYVFMWSCHSQYIFIFIENIYYTIVLSNINYHHHLCHLLFHLFYYHQQHFYHYHHHITSSTFNLSIVTLYESSTPFLYPNHQHHLYHVIYWSSSVSWPLIIIYWALHHNHNLYFKHLWCERHTFYFAYWRWLWVLWWLLIMMAANMILDNNVIKT